MTRRIISAAALLAVVLAVAAPVAFADEWTSKPLGKLLPGGEESEEKVSLKGKMISKEEKDEDGKKLTRGYLEQKDGSLVPLPCERKDGDRGVGGKMAGKAIGGKDSCWDYMGQEVEVLGSMQSIQKKAKRFKRLSKITGINPIG